MERDSQSGKGYMMPKEKAIELYQKYELLGRDFTRGVSMKEHSKQCALIAVDEIIDILSVLPYGMGYLSHIDYWERVKQELL